MPDASMSVGADASAFNASLKKMQRDTDTMANSVTARLARLGQAFQALSGLGGLIKSVGGGLIDAAKAVIEPAAAAETLALSFEVMLGSEQETLRFMDRLNEYAAETPFALDEISEAAKLMLANTSMGADEVMTRLRQIGDLSAMTGKSMRDIAQVYAKAMNVGVTNEVAESLETMGIPIRKTIAELQGISFDEVFDKISKRMLSAEHLNAVLETLTSTGGKFNGATQRLSQTFEGLASTLGDNVNMALRTFGEQLLPQVKPILEKLIAAVDEAMPSVERLGVMFGSWLGEKVDGKLLPALDEMILRLPEVGVQFEYLLAKAQEFADGVLAVPNAIGGAFEWMKKRALEFTAAVNYGLKGEAATRWAERVMAADSPEKHRKEQLAEMRKKRQELQQWAEQQRRQRVAEAQGRDAARQADREAAAEQKKADDEKRRRAMELAEQKKSAAADEKRRTEEDQRRWENYQDRRRNYELAQQKKAHDAMSVRGQERSLRRQARAQGVRGEVSPESIRAKLDELAQQGAKKNEQEIAALERLLTAWDALTERKKNYAKIRREDMTELRIGAMEAAGNKQGAAKLREQLETARRIEELQNAGATKRQAQEQAAMEAKVRQAAALQQQMQSARVEFIQSHQAAQGGGGVSLRLGGSQLEEAKKHSKYLRDIHNWLKNQRRGSNVAVLA